MTRTITIDPVTRIEGHARVVVNMADEKTVESAQLIVNEVRGFERILIGMEALTMPTVTARICGVCPSAHHMASSKALDHLLGVEPPPAGKLMRELLYMGHFIHSHAAHTFALVAPDLFFGVDGDPAVRNIVGLVKAQPELAKKALRLRSLGQKINEKLGGRGVHPVSSVAGGMAHPLAEKDRDELEAMTGEATALATEIVGPTRDLLLKAIERLPALKDGMVLPACSLATVKDGKLDFYEGALRLTDASGATLKEFPAEQYADYLVEKPFAWSYMKPVYFKNNGKEEVYRVGPMARLNCVGAYGTPMADREAATFVQAFGRPCHHTVAQIYARLIEVVYACEKAQALVADPRILGPCRAEAKMRAGRGVGHVEAPRGVLIHDFEVDAKGIVRSANLIVATQQNYAAINESIKQIMQATMKDTQDERMLNAAEFAVRCFDPCLSCATHAWGQMPLRIDIRRDGRVVRTIGKEIRHG